MKPDAHLKTAKAQAGIHELGSAAGLQRLEVTEIRLPAEQTHRFSAPGEAFMYVLAGAGNVTADGQTEPLETGDFIAFGPGEEVLIESIGPDGLSCLISREQPGS